MNKIKITLFLIGVIALTGCVKQAPRYNPHDFQAAHSKKGVVIFQMSEPVKNRKIYPDGDIAPPISINKIGSDEKYDLNYYTVFDHKYNYSERMVMLDPGVYYIDTITLHIHNSGRVLRKYKSPGIKKLHSHPDVFMILRGAFEVKENKVTYLGHLKLRPKWDLGELPFTVHNEIHKVKSDLLSSKFAELSEQVELGTFYNIGSVIMTEKGKSTLIDLKDLKDSVAWKYIRKNSQNNEGITKLKMISNLQI